MKRLVIVLAVFVVTVTIAGYSQMAKQPVWKEAKVPSDAGQMGLDTLSPPYEISTAPHFAVMVQFPKADSIRRIALGDSSYFLAEADKDDPHYAIIKQIRIAGAKGKAPIMTNMLVYMSSGRVINVTLRAGEMSSAAYLIDYPVATTEPETHSFAPSSAESEKAKQEHAREQLAHEMIEDANKKPNKERGSLGGGLNVHLYRVERMGDLALAAFDVENTTSAVVDLQGPQVNLVTPAEKGRDRKKTASNVEPIQLVNSSVASMQLSPGTRVVGLVEFKPPVHDSKQQVVLSVANRATADQPATARIE